MVLKTLYTLVNLDYAYADKFFPVRFSAFFIPISRVHNKENLIAPPRRTLETRLWYIVGIYMRVLTRRAAVDLVRSMQFRFLFISLLARPNIVIFSLYYITIL